MGTEIERRFLVTGDAWRAAALPAEPLRQAYLAKTPAGTVRVRVSPERATLAVKSERRGFVRDEFEYEIPRADAEHMLAALCVSPVLEKMRHAVPHGGWTWSVDVYGGALAGLVIAEIELRDPDEVFDRPPWLGREITHQRAYRNSVLARAQARPRGAGQRAVAGRRPPVVAGWAPAP